MKELHVRNRQRQRRINSDLFRGVIRALLEQELGLTRYGLAIHLVSAGQMAEVNENFLRHSGSTDVITFDYRDGYSEELEANSELAGEIYISVSDAISQAREFSTHWQQEVVRYAVHGILHLRGYDDLAPANRRIMKREENRLTRRMTKQFPVAELGR
jgi:probable rRNA maturation factor